MQPEVIRHTNSIFAVVLSVFVGSLLACFLNVIFGNLQPATCKQFGGLTKKMDRVGWIAANKDGQEEALYGTGDSGRRAASGNKVPILSNFPAQMQSC